MSKKADMQAEEYPTSRPGSKRPDVKNLMSGSQQIGWTESVDDADLGEQVATEQESPVRPYRIITSDSGDTSYVNRILIGTATTGLVRMEWVTARFGQVIPCNWSQVAMNQFVNGYVALNYQVADAQNLIVKAAVEGDFEWCFRRGTLVETASGGKNIEDIRPGELVKTHTGAYSQVIKVMRRPIKTHWPLAWVKTTYSTIKCTPKHPFFIRGDDGLCLVEARSLKLSDRLLYPYHCRQDELIFDIRYNVAGTGYHNLEGGIKNGTHLHAMTISREFARFMGLYLAEGHCDRDGIALTFGNHEAELHEFVEYIYAKYFDRTATIVQRWSTQLRLSIRALSSLFKRWFGTKAHKKRVPEFVFGWDLLNRLEFIKGYLDGDGHYNAGGCTFSSASRELTDGIVRLGQSCGLRFSTIWTIAPTTSTYGHHKISNRGAYMCRVGTQSLGKLMDLLAAEVDGDYLAVPVEDIENHTFPGSMKYKEVYNLEVEGDNSYIAGSAAVHNCLFIEHDTIPPPDAFIRLNDYMRNGDVPVVSGLYFTKGKYTEPLIYRGRGTSYYGDWKLGDHVWCDGVPTGFLLIHGAILREMWKDSEEYIVGTHMPQPTRRVFEAPRAMWYSPDTAEYQSLSGTSDLAWCSRVMEGGYFKKAGWPKYQDMEFPFLVDTNLMCMHIDMDGRQYPTREELAKWKLEEESE